jgi:hypothetical protein
MTRAFRSDFRTIGPARSPAEFEDLMLQPDLFIGDEPRSRWRAKLARAIGVERV